jgi:toxin ParE1/3/4
MIRVIQTARYFTEDFESLFAWYVEKANAEVAWRFQSALDESLNRLAIHPELGRLRHFRHPDLAGIRSFRVDRPFGNLLIFYRASDDTLQVIRLMHGARDLSRRLREPPVSEG